MKVPYHNDTDKFVHIGPITVAPGGTRDVDETHIPGHRADPKNEQLQPEDPIEALSKLSVKVIMEKFPELSDAELERLGELEQLKGDEARTTLLGGITSEMFHRADLKAAG